VIPHRSRLPSDNEDGYDHLLKRHKNPLRNGSQVGRTGKPRKRSFVKGEEEDEDEDQEADIDEGGSENAHVDDTYR